VTNKVTACRGDTHRRGHGNRLGALRESRTARSSDITAESPLDTYTHLVFSIRFMVLHRVARPRRLLTIPDLGRYDPTGAKRDCDERVAAYLRRFSGLTPLSLRRLLTSPSTLKTHSFGWALS
jgi:hypothetical protein